MIMLTFGAVFRILLLAAKREDNRFNEIRTALEFAAIQFMKPKIALAAVALKGILCMRKYLRIAALIVIISGVLFVGSGFSKRTDVCLVNYAASEDGSVITMQTTIAGSMGYIRSINTNWQDDTAYCSFYSAFGGLNSSIGAKNEFTLKLDDSVSKIYFDRGKEDKMLVLQRNNDGVWIRP